MSVGIEYLPLAQKKHLVTSLLDEFGIQYREQKGSELTHKCALGLGGHSNGTSWTASINYDKLKFNCFVCGNKGPLSWWVSIMKKTDDEKALLWLTEKSGIRGGLDLKTNLQILDAIWHPTKETEEMPFYDDRLLRRWTEWETFHPYLTLPLDAGGRALPEDNLRRFDIGYADSDTDFGYDQRIIIPARWEGNLVGWQARALSPADPEYHIKYKNSPAYPRNRILWGVTEGRKEKVLVESPMSVLRHCHHVEMVSTMGAQVTEAQLRLLSRYAGLTIWFDPDEAGNKATRDLIHKLKREMPLWVVQNPYSNDPAEIPDDEVDRLLAEAVPSGIWRAKYKGLKDIRKAA